MSNRPAEQPSQGQDFQLFPDADHMSLEQPFGDNASPNAGICLSWPTHHASNCPNALAAVFSAESLQDADTSQLLAQIAELSLKLQTVSQQKIMIQRAFSALEANYEVLKQENIKLATSLAQAQQRCEDNKPRRFEYGNLGK